MIINVALLKIVRKHILCEVLTQRLQHCLQISENFAIIKFEIDQLSDFLTNILT